MSRSIGRTRRCTAVLAALSALAALLALAPATASAVGTGTVTGVVTFQGTPVPNAGVYVACQFVCPSTVAGSDGTFTFSGLPAGNVQIFATPGWAPPSQFAAPSPTATVAVPDGGTTAQNLALSVGGAVAGQVVDHAGTPLAFGNVAVCPAGTPPNTVTLWCNSVNTDAGGYFSSRGVDAASADVIVMANYQSFGGRTNGVALTPGAVTSGANVVVDQGVTVSGTVVDGTGTPIDGATLQGSPAMLPTFPVPTTSGGGLFSGVRVPSTASLKANPPVGRPDLTSGTVPIAATPGSTVSVTITLAAASRISSTFTAVNGSLGSFKVAFVCPIGSTFALSFQCVAPSGALSSPPGNAGFTDGSVTGLPPGSYVVRGATTNTPGSGTFSPPETIDVAGGDVITCAFTIDMSGGPGGSAACTGDTGTPPSGGNSVTLPPATGGGTATITSPIGTTLADVVPVSTAGATLPPGASMPFGAFSFRLTGLAPGASADVTVTYPASTPTPNGYVKFVGGHWVDASSIVQSQAPGTVTIRLVDGGPWDADGAPNGTLVDPGGPAVLDQVAPTVAVTGVADGAGYTLGAVPTAGCTAADEAGGSGLDTPVCSVSVTGGGALGVGTFTATATATDRAGNHGTATATYTVRFAATGFDSPVDNLPVVNSGRAGRAYPVTWALTDAAGRPVTDLSAVTSLRYRSLGCSTTASTTEAPLEVEATGGSALRITSGRFQVNWATPSTPGCYELLVGLADGSTLKAQFHLR